MAARSEVPRELSPEELEEIHSFGASSDSTQTHGTRSAFKIMRVLWDRFFVAQVGRQDDHDGRRPRKGPSAQIGAPMSAKDCAGDQVLDWTLSPPRRPARVLPRR